MSDQSEAELIHKCRKCGVIYEDGGRMTHHVYTHYSSRLWPWNWAKQIPPSAELIETVEIAVIERDVFGMVWSESDE